MLVYVERIPPGEILLYTETKRRQEIVIHRLTLEVIDDVRTGVCFTFDDRQHVNVIAGRADNCDICVPGDHRVSRQHFMVKIRSDGMWICDLVSRNGIYINGIQYGGPTYANASDSGGRDQCPQVALKDGDEIRAGRTWFRVRMDDYQLCPECGGEIPESDSARTAAIESALACSACRERMVGTGSSADGSSGRSHCSRCGKYLSDTIDADRYTGTLCLSCQPHVDAAPATLLRHLIKHIRVPRAGDRLPNIKGFTIERQLGACSLGAVYLAHRIRDDTLVALKIMQAIMATSGREWKKIEQALLDIRFRRGARILGALDRDSKQITIHIAMKVAAGHDIQRILDDLPSQDNELPGMGPAAASGFFREPDRALQAS